MKEQIVSIWDRKPLAIFGAVLGNIPHYVELRHEHSAVHPVGTIGETLFHYVEDGLGYSTMKVVDGGPVFVQKGASRVEILASSEVPPHEAWAVDSEAYHELVVELFLRSFQFERMEGFDVSKPGELLASMLRLREYPEICVQIIWRRDQIFEGVY